MQRWISVLMLVMVAGSCASETPDARERRADAYVTADGSTVTTGGRIGVAALIRTRGNAAVGPIELRVRFLDPEGSVIDTTVDSLPYCLPDTDCFYGGTFDSRTRVRSAELAVEETATYRERGQISPFSISRRPDGRVYGRAPDDEGYAYVIAFSRGRPKWGTWRSIEPDDRRTVVFAPSDVPVFGNDVTLRGFFYSARVPAGE